MKRGVHFKYLGVKFFWNNICGEILKTWELTILRASWFNNFYLIFFCWFVN